MIRDDEEENVAYEGEIRIDIAPMTMKGMVKRVPPTYFR